MKIEIFKNKKRFKKGGFRANPNIGWELILYIAFFLTAASLAFGIYLFIHTNAEFKMPDQSDNSSSRIVKKERVIKVLEYFSSREKKSAEILNSPAPFIDPSL